MPVNMMAAALAAAAVQACPPASEAEVQRTFDDWTAAYEARDLERVMSIFSPQVVFAFQGGPDIGAEALRKGYERSFSAPANRSRWVQSLEAVLVSGDLADVFSTWRLVEPGATAAKETNRSVDVLWRGPGCAWRIVRSLNYPVQPRPPKA